MPDPNAFAARLAELGVPAPWKVGVTIDWHVFAQNGVDVAMLNPNSETVGENDTAIARAIVEAVNEKAGVTK